MLIDMKTFDLVTKPYGEWDRLGQDNARRWKNPKTREFTMAIPIRCASCGATIPAPPFYGMSLTEGPERDAAMKARAEYKCPKCGKRAIGGKEP